MGNRKHKPATDKFTKTRFSNTRNDYVLMTIRDRSEYVYIGAMLKSGVIVTHSSSRYSITYKVRKGYVSQCKLLGFTKY